MVTTVVLLKKRSYLPGTKVFLDSVELSLEYVRQHGNDGRKRSVEMFRRFVVGSGSFHNCLNGHLFDVVVVADKLLKSLMRKESILLNTSHH